MPKADLQERVERLEQSLIRLGVIVVGVVAVSAIIVYSAHVRSAPEGRVLRVGGLIVTDSAGRDRILLGAPIPGSESRRRDDPSVGLLIMDERGVDRLAVASPTPDPQGGTRVSPATGIQLNGPEGEERAGFSVMEDGRATMVLDHEEDRGEAVGMFVLPEQGLTGLLVNGVRGSPRQRVFLGTEYDGLGAGVLVLHDSAGRTHSTLGAPEDDGTMP